MQKCDAKGCEKGRAPGEMQCYQHWWGEYKGTPRDTAELLFDGMDIVTQDSSKEVGLLEHVLTEAEKRGMGGNMPFAMTPAEIQQLQKAGKLAEEAFKELGQQMVAITKRLTSSLNRFHSTMAECGLVKEQTQHGPIYLIKKLQEQGILPKIEMKIEKDENRN